MKGQTLTRLEIMKIQKDKGRAVDFGLPDIDEGRYIIEAMNRLGPTRAAGMGEGPTDWDIIWPWAQATGRLSEPWEMETLADMCAGYHRARIEGEDPLSIPPVDRSHSG